MNERAGRAQIPCGPIDLPCSTEIWVFVVEGPTKRTFVHYLQKSSCIETAHQIGVSCKWAVVASSSGILLHTSADQTQNDFWDSSICTCPKQAKVHIGERAFKSTTLYPALVSGPAQESRQNTVTSPSGSTSNQKVSALPFFLLLKHQHVKRCWHVYVSLQCLSGISISQWLCCYLCMHSGNKKWRCPADFKLWASMEIRVGDAQLIY